MKAIAFIEALGCEHYVYSAQVDIRDAAFAGKLQEDIHQALRDAVLFSPEFFFYEHLTDGASLVTDGDQRNGAYKLPVGEGAPEVAAGADVETFDVHKIRLLLSGDSNLEFQLLDGEDQVDSLGAMAIVQGSDGYSRLVVRLCHFRNLIQNYVVDYIYANLFYQQRVVNRVSRHKKGLPWNHR